MQKKRYVYQPPGPSAQETDCQLVYEALHGAHDPWNALYQEALPLVIDGLRKYDRCHIFNADVYLDAADEAFARCYEQLDRYQGRGRFWRWVLGYGKNILHELGRKQATARRNQYLLEARARSRIYSQDPLQILLRIERDCCLWEVFDGLSLPEKTLLWQQVFFNIPPRRLAKKLQLTRKQAQQCYEDALFKMHWHFCRLYP